MNYVVYLRFRCVERRSAMTNVLCTLEYSECKAGEEITSRQQTSCWSKSKTGVLFQEVRHLPQLWDLIRSENVIVLQHLESVPVFHAEMFGHQVQYVVKNCSPCANFISSIVNDWDDVTAINIITLRVKIKKKEKENNDQPYNLYSKAMLAISFLRAR